MAHKSGFVNIIGFPNVGKSTLMNRFTGEKLSIITPKAQTTRKRIIGIVNNENYQIVFSDTPGLLKPKYLLQESMLKHAKSALKDADILIYMTDVNEEPDNENEIFKILNNINIPLLLLINKIDLIDNKQISLIEKKWQSLLPKAQIFKISALGDIGLNPVFEKILELLPENPPYYDKDSLTDLPLRFFVAEIIREKIMLQYNKEVPYSAEVIIEEYKENQTPVLIRAVIFVEKESQKAIIIGQKGKAIKKLGIEARKDIENFIDQRVYLELVVKVNPNWRNNAELLKKMGY